LIGNSSLLLQNLQDLLVDPVQLDARHVRYSNITFDFSLNWPAPGQQPNFIRFAVILKIAYLSIRKR
jgi:hypothetical protein